MSPLTYHLRGRVTASRLQSRLTGEWRGPYGQALALEDFPFSWVIWFNRKTTIDEGATLAKQCGSRRAFHAEYLLQAARRS